MKLIESLIREGWLKTERIIKAFQKIKREDFLPDNLKHLADLNEALPIGYGQTISQPLVVAFMLELLEPKEGDKILDIGSGSGWTTALLAEIVGKKGKVIGIEIIPELKEFGEKNVSKYNFLKEKRVKFICQDGTEGFKKEAPFDGILCSAALKEEVPIEWKKQLKIGGRLVTPIGFSLWKFLKKEENEFEKKEYPGFAFVPLVKNVKKI